MTEEQRLLRGKIVSAVLIVVFGLLLVRLGYIQLLHGDEYAMYAQQQRVRPLEVVPARGDIIDRHGIPLAVSRPAYTASLVYTGAPLPEDARRLLKQTIGIEDAEIDAALAELQTYPFQPARLRVDLSSHQHTALEELRHLLPGVVVEALPLRTYPHGSLAAHVLGYLRQQGEWTVRGVDGIEKSFETVAELAEGSSAGLAGESGRLLVEVDALGRPVQALEREDPRPGDTLRLTLDARLQSAAEAALAETMERLRETTRGVCPCPAPAASAVVLEVDTGAILAMVSLPSYDPNVFALQPMLRRGSERRATVDALISSYIEEGVFLNRAIQGRYPPGSVFKVVTALAGVTHGLENMRVNCGGSLHHAGRTFRDTQAHGSTDLEKAIGRSCNVYFWTMGLRLGTANMGEMATLLGLNGTTGLKDLEGEVAGSFPFEADPLNTAIGQGAHLYTPLQIASLMATVATNGIRYRPYLVEEILTPDSQRRFQAEPEVMAEVEVPAGVWQRVINGMVGVTSCRSGWCGTATGSFADAPYTVAGKTGTVERSGLGSAWNHAWFASFAPAGAGERPEIAVAVMIEGGGGGSAAAAPVARQIYDVYFGLAPSPLDDGEELPISAGSTDRNARRLASREGG